MKFIRYKYPIGQAVNMGNIKVTVEEHREFWGKPSYKVSWFDKMGNLNRAVLKENEIS